MYSHKKIRISKYVTENKAALVLHTYTYTKKVLYFAAQPDWVCISLLTSCKFPLAEFDWLETLIQCRFFWFILDRMEMECCESSIYNFFVCFCLFSPAAVQDVECVQFSSCFQGRTLVQCMTQLGLLYSARTQGYLVFTKGAWHG